MKTGRMIVAVEQLGTRMRLAAGERVVLIRATNLPSGGWFARPLHQGGSNSIHVSDSDVSLD